MYYFSFKLKDATMFFKHYLFHIALADAENAVSISLAYIELRTSRKHPWVRLM